MSTPGAHTESRNESLLGSEPIGSLLARMSIPAMLAMLVQATYNIVDTIFIGRGVGALAIGGLTVAFPFQIFMMAIALMLGTGAASVVSRALGAGDRDRAAQTVGTTVTVAAILGLVLSVVGLALTEPILRLFGASDQLIPYASEYLGIILIGTPFITVAMASNNLIRAEGNARYAMVVMLVGAVGNIILDPIFIFAFNMGIRGAATATVIAQGLSLLAAIRFYAFKKTVHTLRARHFVPRPQLIGPVALLGLPAFIRQFGATFVAILVNNAAVTYGGDLAVASFGVINRVLIFALMTVFGLAQGYQPIAGYNYGAGKYSRVRESTRFAAAAAIIITGFFFALMVSIPGTLLSLFSTSSALLEIAVPAMRTVVFVLPLVGVQVIGATYFLAIGKALPSLFLGMLRQIILLIPLILTLPRVLGLRGVWLAFPIADALAAAITLAALAVFIRRLPVGEAAPAPAP